VVLRLPPGRVHDYGFLLVHLTGPVGCEKQRLCSSSPSRGQGGASSAIPARPSGPARPGRPGHRAFFLGTRIEEAPHAPPVGAGAAPPPNPPPRPAASGSHRLPNTLARLVSNMGHRSPHLFARASARCPFLPLLRPYFPGGAARGSHAGQFACFGPRSCFIAFVLDIPSGFWPSNRAVGRAYIRGTVPSNR
jgi:hypothetical protein